MSDRKLRIGVVGLGKMGLVHSSMINVLPGVQLVAVCEKNSMIRKFAKKLFKGVDVVDDVAKLTEFDLDAIYVTTPIPTHFPIVKTICSANIAPNIFVEKTLCQKYEESKQLCDLVEKTNGVNMVGYLRRFYVTFRKTKDLLSEGAIGHPVSFRAYAYSSDFHGTKELPSRGGVLRDLGCYAIDLAQWFFDEFTVDSVGLAAQTEQQPDELISFESSTPDGLIGHFDISWRKENYRMPEVGFSINGADGEILVNDDKVELRPETGKAFVWYRHDLNDGVQFCLGLPEYYREDSQFIDSILRCHRTEPNFSAATKVDQIISQVEKAGENNLKE